MKRLFRPYLSIFLLGSLLITSTSCGDSDDPDPIDEQEEIASAKITFEPEGKGNLSEATTAQPGLTLVSPKTYTGTLTLYDAEGNDITAEISDEGTKHEVFYISTVPGVTVTTTDQDDNGRPLGLESTLVTTAPGTGTLRVLLKHQPDKGSTSDMNKGATDLDMTIQVVVQ